MNAPSTPTDREVISKARRIIDRSHKQIEQQRKALNEAAERINVARAREIGDQLAKEYDEATGAAAAEALVKLLGLKTSKRSA